VLAILVTEGGLVRHWPIRVGFMPTARQINLLNRFLNDNIRGCSISEAQATVMAKLRQMEAEFKELSALASALLGEVGRVVDPEALYVEGADNILSHAEEIGDIQAVQSLIRVIGEKDAIAHLMENELDIQRKDRRGQKGLKPNVRIGRETGIAALKDLSLVTTAYWHGDQIVGVLGILGSKRMEYSRMMSIVEYMSGIVSRKLESWDAEGGDEL
jgi:heat-inducible transcriptional repressor